MHVSWLPQVALRRVLQVIDPAMPDAEASQATTQAELTAAETVSACAAATWSASGRCRSFVGTCLVLRPMSD
jgi:hypothetical protein